MTPAMIRKRILPILIAIIAAVLTAACETAAGTPVDPIADIKNWIAAFVNWLSTPPVS